MNRAKLSTMVGGWNDFNGDKSLAESHISIFGNCKIYQSFQHFQFQGVKMASR
jgi:hypothetical protein